MPLAREIRWRPYDATGLEHLSLVETADGFLIRSVVIGERDSAPYGVWYEVALTPEWLFRRLSLQRTDGRSLDLRCDGGAWTVDGRPAPALAACIDIDVSATPFTNTLPIRRAELAIGETRQFTMAYVAIDTLAVIPDGQIYTRLAADHYRYQAADRSFEAEITVDADGLVLDYPPLFTRE